MNDNLRERRDITGDPITACQSRIHSGQTITARLMAIQAERVINNLAGMLSHRRGGGDLLEILGVCGVSTEGEFPCGQGRFPNRLQSADGLSQRVINEAITR